VAGAGQAADVMTTIAYDGKSVVADRFWGTCYGDKLTQVGDKIVAFTGAGYMYNRVIEYFTTGGDPPALGDRNEVLVVDINTGQAVLYDNDMDPLEVDCPVAIGTGAMAALGVMAQGGDAMDAVLLAATIDASTKVDQGVSQLYVQWRSSGNQTTDIRS